MAAAQKINRVHWDSDLLASFAPSVAANPWGFGRPEEVLSGAHAFEYCNEGQHALIAVRPVHRRDGIRLDVVGLVSIGDRLHAFEFDAAMVQIAGEFDACQLAMSTMRPHIASAAKLKGWTQTGVLMIKKIGFEQ